MAVRHDRLATFLCLICLTATMMLLPSVPAFAAGDAYEPNDTIDQATQITADGVTQMHWSEGVVIDHGRVDWLCFEAQAGQVYHLNVWRGTVWALPVPSFHYADGTAIESEGDYHTGGWFFYADRNGPVYIKLFQMDVGSYFFSLKGGDASEFGFPDQYEPDNTIRSAKDIPVDGTIQRRAADIERDLLRFRVRKDMVYRVEVGWESGSEYMLASVVDTNGALALGDEFVDQWNRVRYFTASSDAVLYLKCRMGYGSAPYFVSIKEIERSVLAGVVKRATDGEPVAGARVKVFDSDLTGFHSGQSSRITTTAADGTWRLHVQPGTYVALFEDSSGDLLGEYYGGTVPPSYTASQIAVHEQETLPTIDGRLWSKASISGVVALQDGTPVGGSAVTLDYLVPGGWWNRITVGTRTSDASGRFTFTGLDPRLSYRLIATPVGAYIPDAPTGVSLLTGRSTDVTVPLYPPGSISGTVTDESRGIPAAGIQVEVWGVTATTGKLSQGAITDSSGHYRVSGLVSGSYRLRFVDPSGPAGPYGQDFWGESDYGWQDIIPVAIGRDTADIDYQFRDTLPPITTGLVTSAWQKGPVPVALTATDQGWMGVGSTWFSLPLTVPQPYTEPFTITAEGTSTIVYWSQDNTNADGYFNAEEPKSLTVRIDNTPPTTSMTMKTAYDRTAVSFSATDAHSGVASIHYTIDGGPSQTGRSVTVSGAGSHVIDYWSVDLAGNVSSRKAALVQVIDVSSDATAPVLAAAISADVAGKVTMTASASDDGDSNPTIRYKIGMEPARTYIAPVQFATPGSYSVVVTATDAAGNVASKALRFTVSTTPVGTFRVGGHDRYAVAVSLADLICQDRGMPFTDVIIACGEDRAMADPLGASALAAAYDCPVLLTQPQTANSRTVAAVKAMRDANGGKLNIHVVGGTASISGTVYNQFAALRGSGTCERISGADRYHLAKNMAERVSQVAGAPEAVLVVNIEDAKSFNDALAASPISAHANMPLIGVQGAGVPAGAKAALALFPNSKRYAVNSAYLTSAVRTSTNCEPITMASSSNREVAATQIAKFGVDNGLVSYANVGLVNKLSDALPGGALLGQLDGVLLYTDSAPLSTTTSAFVNAHRSDISDGWIFGGPISIADSTMLSFDNAQK